MAPFGSEGRERDGAQLVWGRREEGGKKGRVGAVTVRENEEEREIKKHGALFSSTPVIPRLICVSGSRCESLGATTLDSSVIFECVCFCVFIRVRLSDSQLSSSSVIALTT